MKFGDFLFPESRTPDTDYTVVNEALAETELADRLGYHSVWLGEHHFDGVCTYADPMAFGGAVVARTNNVRVGFSAVQTAFPSPCQARGADRSAGQSQWRAHHGWHGAGVCFQSLRIPRLRRRNMGRRNHGWLKQRRF